MNHKYCLLLLLGMHAWTTPSAQNKAMLDSLEKIWDKQYNLSEIVVTATRTPKTLKDVPVLTRIITHADIQKADATNIQDMLQTEMPGVEFSYSMNQQVNMNLCGFAGQGVLLLVDGERLAGETLDNTDFARLSMANVERIEIVRGTASALYGSNAAGGVVNIITRKENRPWTLHLDGRWGKHSAQRYNGVWGVKRGIFSNSMMLSYNSSDNYQVSNRGNAPQTSTFSQVYGEKTLNFSDRITLDLSHGLHVTGKVGFFRRTVNRVSDSQERYRDYQAGLKAEWQMTHRDYIQASYNFDQYDKSDFLRTHALDIRKYSNVQNSMRLLYNHTFRQKDILSVGADYTYDYLMNANLHSGTRRQQSFDAFAQYDWHVTDRWEVLGAMRYDYFSDGGMSRLTPKFSARWIPHHRITLRASYGMGFRAPTLKEKYYDFDMAGIWIVQGNPELKPELSHNLTLGAECHYKGYQLTLNANYNHLMHRITTGLPFQTEGSSQWYLAYMNLHAMNVFSVEATVNARWKGGFSAKAAYMYTHEAMAPKTANQYMPSRPHSLTARGEWDKQFSQTLGLNVALSGRVLSAVDNTEYVSISAPDEGTRQVHYPAYSIWKLQLTGRFQKWMRLTFTIDNLFDYRPKYYYYNAPLTQGINVMGGISIDLNQLKKQTNNNNKDKR